jgi:hypothetical protein
MLYVGERKIAERVAAPASALTARSVVDTRRPGALIVGGDCGSLSVIRSLGRHGIPSRYVTDIDFLAKFSRYTKGSAAWPGPGHPTALSFLVQLAEQEGLNGWLLIPIGDAEVEFVAKNRERLAATFRLTTPDWDTIRWAVDKKLTYQRAEMLGIPFPRTYNVRRLEDVERLDFLFPLILKPAKKEEINAFTLAKAWRVDDRAELRARFIQAACWSGPAQSWAGADPGLRLGAIFLCGSLAQRFADGLARGAAHAPASRRFWQRQHLRRDARQRGHRGRRRSVLALDQLRRRGGNRIQVR